MGFPKEISTQALSTLLGIAPRTISKLVNKKVLNRLERGTFDAARAVQSYVAHRESVVAAEHGIGAYGKARAQLYLERARIARIEREELEGSVVRVSETTAAWTSLAAMICKRIQAVPSHSAPRLVKLKTAAEAKDIVERAINEALEDIQNVEIRRTASPETRQQREEVDAD